MTIDVPPGTDVTVSPASRTFTTNNYDVPKTVTVRAGTDSDDDDEMVTLAHTPTGGGYGGAMLPALTVKVIDKDGRVIADETAADRRRGRNRDLRADAFAAADRDRDGDGRRRGRRRDGKPEDAHLHRGQL